MPAYTQHHQQHHDLTAAATFCPSCFLAMQIREVKPHWNLARLDCTYECTACGSEVCETIAEH